MLTPYHTADNVLKCRSESDCTTDPAACHGHRRQLRKKSSRPSTFQGAMSASTSAALGADGLRMSTLKPQAQQPIAPCTPLASQLWASFSMQDLDEIHEHLWFAGSRVHIETLHHQRVLLRTIIPSTSPSLHLIWFHRIMYIMPMPDCLLNASYYSDNVCNNLELYSIVIGFFRSYCSLIHFPIDLTLAQDLHLLPNTIRREQWIIFREEQSPINKRYEYGKVRLHRLHLIYRFTGRGLTYFTAHREYQKRTSLSTSQSLLQFSRLW